MSSRDDRRHAEDFSMFLVQRATDTKLIVIVLQTHLVSQKYHYRYPDRWEIIAKNNIFQARERARRFIFRHSVILFIILYFVTPKYTFLNANW